MWVETISQPVWEFTKDIFVDDLLEVFGFFLNERSLFF